MAALAGGVWETPRAAAPGRNLRERKRRDMEMEARESVCVRKGREFAGARRAEVAAG